MAEKRAGWVDVDLFDFWCVRCAPTLGDAAALAHLNGEGEGRLAPVGEVWASRQVLRCAACGRRL